MPLIPQDRIPNPEVTAPGIVNLVALLPPPQDLHTILRHPAKSPLVAHLLLTPGLTVPPAWLLVLTIQVAVDSFPSMPGVTKLPNNRNGPPKEIRLKRPLTWPHQCLTSKLAEMSMVMAIYQLRHQAPNPLSRRRHHHHPNLITLLHYR